MDYYGTIGPACADQDILKKMAEAGMTGLRMNLSHGSLKMYGEWIHMIREAGIRDLLIDLQGPELRVQGLAWKDSSLILQQGESEDTDGIQRVEELQLEIGMQVRCICSDAESFMDRQFNRWDGPMISCPEILDSYLVPGQEILLDDGKLALKVQNRIGAERPVCIGDEMADRAGRADITAVVIRGGVLKNRKSIALPGQKIKTPTLTSEDMENLCAAREAGVTGVMLPFVRGREDILTLKAALKSCGAEEIRIFAKIENQEGVRTLPEFIKDVDHVVIARGDLGNSMPLWELPGCQKRLSALCREAGTPFMVVTQMLDSMHTRAVPTRAEVSDIYNAVMDGASSVMLTGETAAGSYPVEAMRYLVNTAKCAAKDRNYWFKYAISSS